MKKKSDFFADLERIKQDLIANKTPPNSICLKPKPKGKDDKN